MSDKYDRKRMHKFIQNCNGEVRLMSARYGGGWYCALSLCEETEPVRFNAAYQAETIWDVWYDLVGGDNDYLAAEKALESHEYSEHFFLARASRPQEALAKAEHLALEFLNKGRGQLMGDKHTINDDTLTIHKDMTGEELNEAAEGHGIKNVVISDGSSLTYTQDWGVVGPLPTNYEEGVQGVMVETECYSGVFEPLKDTEYYRTCDGSKARMISNDEGAQREN